MSNFADGEENDSITTKVVEKVSNDENEQSDNENTEENVESSAKEVIKIEMIDASKPKIVKYCPFCSFPPEYCEYGIQYQEKCLPWIVENAQEVLSPEQLAKLLGNVNINDEEETGKKKSKKTGVAAPKKKAVVEVKVSSFN